MHTRQRMSILLKLPGPDYEAATFAYQTGLREYVDQVDKALTDGGPLSRVQAFRDYSVYCRWPIRQLEYSFAIRCMPSQPVGHLLDIGSGVTPWPYFLSRGGWPTTTIDLEVDQVVAMRRYGLDTFGSIVDHRVADARGMGFTDGQFAVVTCISVLEHLQHADVPVALAEMVRVCRPGARIILTLDVRAIDDPSALLEYGPFPVKTLERIFSPIAASCGVADEFAGLVADLHQLKYHDLERFWTEHWKPGLWQEKNRGYCGVGMVFDLPDTSEDCNALIATLRETALQMDYPPSDQPSYQVQIVGGHPLWIVGDQMMAEALAKEDFESEVQRFLEHFLRPGDSVFDVGANVGFYTLLSSRLVGPSGDVYAFEPTEQTFTCLVRNTLIADANIRLNRMGLSHENGPLTLFHGEYDSANSFGEPVGFEVATEGQYGSEKVWCTTLDEYVRDYAVLKIDVIKIDVEGWEERIVRGGIGTLASLSPVLILEFCSPAARHTNSSCEMISRLLKALDYDIFRYEPDTRNLEPVETNRNAWWYANLIAIKHTKLSDVLYRLRGSDSMSVVVDQSTQSEEGSQIPLANRYTAPDILVLLEENRSLRQRLTAGLLDREVTTLMKELQASKADGAARLEVTARLIDELEAVRADRAAKDEVIARLIDEFEAVRADQSAKEEVIARLQAALETKEAVITQLGAELSEYKSLGWGLAHVIIGSKHLLRRRAQQRAMSHDTAPKAPTVRTNTATSPVLHVALDVMQIQFGVSGGVEIYMKTLVRALTREANQQVRLTLLCTPDQVPHFQAMFGDLVSYHTFDCELAVSLLAAIRNALRGKARSPAAAYANVSGVR